MVAINTQYQGTPDGFCTSDDIVTMGLQAATHWDALQSRELRRQALQRLPGVVDHCRRPARRRCGIARIATLVSRGVLLDVARALGRERLEAGYGITPDDLDAAARARRRCDDPARRRGARPHRQHAAVQGDVIARRTRAVTNPGSRWRRALWFRERDVAAVATDTVAFEVYPGERRRRAVPRAPAAPARHGHDARAELRPRGAGRRLRRRRRATSSSSRRRRCRSPAPSARR